jgi:hypothetical protein
MLCLEKRILVPPDRAGNGDDGSQIQNGASRFALHRIGTGCASNRRD